MVSRHASSKRSSHVERAIRRALAVSLTASASCLLLGCPECSDDTESLQSFELPPARCDGKPVAAKATCAAPAVTDWSLPDGGASNSYHEARAAWLAAPCAAACKAVGIEATSCRVDSNGPASKLECTYIHDGSCYLAAPGKGRRPTGFEASARDADDLGSFLVAMGELEDASVPAFLRLKMDLQRVGAPHRLRRAAGRAARDERRHTRAAFAFARRVGVAPRRAIVASARARSLIAIAIENAVEGCVHELHGALIAAYAAKQSVDPNMRAMMARVAVEETSHAELAFELVTFFEPRLTREERHRVRDAVRDAVRALPASVGHFPKLAADGVLPPREVHLALLDSVRNELWRWLE